MSEAKTDSQERALIEQEAIVDGKINLNNFYCCLANPRYKEGCAYASMATRAGLMDTPGSELHQSGWSEKMESKTPREFYKEVDDIARNTPGVDYQKMLQMQAQKYDMSKDLGPWARGMSRSEELAHDRKLSRVIKMMDKLQKYILPIYVELRMRGYSRLDLTM